MHRTNSHALTRESSTGRKQLDTVRWVMDTAGWYRWFAENEARGSSPQYEQLANAVADSAELLDWLSHLPGAKRQPNLLFASIRYLGGPTDDADDLVEFVRTKSAALRTTMKSRSTQTNEVARCAAFVPMLGQLDAEIGLIEIGASAGLCLFPDRYAYSYDGKLLGDSPLVIDVDTAGPVPIPERLPTVVWRAGLDLNPLDVSDRDDLAWLRACIWPEHDERRRRLDLAAAIVADDPPRLDRGDLRTATLDLIDDAPSGAVKVVFHSAVLAYVDEAGRHDFAVSMKSVLDQRADVVWISNEAPSVVAGVPEPEHRSPGSAESAQFRLGRNGTHLIALTDPHGRWIEWIDG